MLKDYISEIFLASQSPARSELLRKEGLVVHACPQDCLELTDKTQPGDVVEALSLIKLKSFMNSKDYSDGCTAIACDTLLWFENSLIGKAHNCIEAREQISHLAGKTHQVYSGYALYYKGQIYHGYDYADVTFKPISKEQLDEYVLSNEWKGAAGSYHLFGKAVDFVKSVSGDVNTVIGLPLKKIEKIVGGEK